MEQYRQYFFKKEWIRVSTLVLATQFKHPRKRVQNNETVGNKCNNLRLLKGFQGTREHGR